MGLLRFLRGERGSGYSATAAGVAAATAATLIALQALAPEGIGGSAAGAIQDRIASVSQAGGAGASTVAQAGTVQAQGLFPDQGAPGTGTAGALVGPDGSPAPGVQFSVYEGDVRLGTEGIPAGTIGADAVPVPREPGFLEQAFAPGQVGRGLGLIAAGAPIDQTLLATIVPPLTAAGVGAGLDAVGAPEILHAGVTNAAVTTALGAVTGEVDLDAVALAGAGGLARSVTDTVLQGVPVIGDSGALGKLVENVVRGGDLGKAAIDAGAIAVGSILPPGFSPFLSAFAGGINGRPPGPGAFIGAAAGAALGPLGALGGGFLGGLLDGFLGFGRPKKFTLTDDIDVTGNGRGDEIRGYIKNKDYGYIIKSGIRDLPLQRAHFRLQEEEVNVVYKERERRFGLNRNREPEVDHYTTPRFRESSRGRRLGPDTNNETKYFLDVTYEWDRLFPPTDQPRTRLEGYRHDRENDRVTGFEITEEQYRQLRRELGGTQGTVGGRSAAARALLQYAPEAGPVEFRQQKVGEGLHFRYDVNGDGIPDVVRWFPTIDGFVKGDERFEVVSLGV